jgi:adenine-specific DNA methylase
MTPPSRSPVFIEKIFPVNLLNLQVYFENGGNPFKGLHRWYSRKPLSFSRASVLGSLLPADISMEEFEYLLGLDRAGANESELAKQDRHQRTRLYKTPPSAERVQRVQELCEQVWGDKTPAVLDAFAGGGSIPFEAARYGLRVFASDLNPVAVVTMKAAIEFPLKFGAELQGDIDKWVQWVGEQAEIRLKEFFPCQEGETIQNYLWAHTVQCPHCSSTVPLSPNWWLSKTSNYAGKGQERKVTSDWYAVKPIPNLVEKRVDFELIQGKKGKGNTIEMPGGDYNPDDFSTMSRGVGKCLNCESILEETAIKKYSAQYDLGHQLYAVAFKKKKGGLGFRLPNAIDLKGFNLSSQQLEKIRKDFYRLAIIPSEATSLGLNDSIRNYEYGLKRYEDCFNIRQLLTLASYVEIINEIKEKIRLELGEEKLHGIVTYLALVLDRCIDKNSRLSHVNTSKGAVEGAMGQHSLNLFWNYPEISGNGYLWKWCAGAVSSEYKGLCQLLGTKVNSLSIQTLENHTEKTFQIDSASADSLFHLADQSIHTIVTDPPYYSTIQYAELSDFFYVWQKRILGDIFPELYYSELTDKDREAVANPSRFRDMGVSPKILADQDYEAKMQMAFSEYYRVLKNDGVMTVQFNHKDSGAWDVLAQSLITAGFEITASWAVSTENPQNLHQAQKNSVSSTVLLVCRKRDPNSGSAWWDDIRPELTRLVEQRAPEFEANDITGIDLYLSAFGPALNVFSRAWPVLDSAGYEMRPEIAFEEARKAISHYRLNKLLNQETSGFDALTQWYILAWDTFRAREFPFDDARQLGLAVGGFDISDLKTEYKLIEAKSGTCTLLSPQQRLKKRAFSVSPTDFSFTSAVDALHAVIAIYLEEQSIEPVRQFLIKTELLSNDAFMKAWEVVLKAIPLIRDEKKRIPEEKALADLWLAMDEIKAKVRYVLPTDPEGIGQARQGELPI